MIDEDDIIHVFLTDDEIGAMPIKTVQSVKIKEVASTAPIPVTQNPAYVSLLNAVTSIDLPGLQDLVKKGGNLHQIDSENQCTLHYAMQLQITEDQQETFLNMITFLASQ
jgi:hypothetical protein